MSAISTTAARVDLWTWRLDQPDEAVLWPLLSGDEKARADRYGYPKGRTQFIASRGRVRQILGERTGADPAALAFDKGEHGKPSLAGRPDVRFNFSDSGALGCLAIAEEGASDANGPVGVDIEAMRPRNYLEIAERFFSPAEHAILASLDPLEQAPAFFRGWTRKEAFLKAVGTGLSTRLDAFEVTIGHEQAARMTRIDPSIDADISAWALAHITPAPDFMGAIALRAGGAPIEVVVRETPDGAGE